MSIFDGDMRLCATAASGVEAVLKRELSELGFAPSPAENGKIFFDGGLDDVARANVFLRTANKIYVEAARFACRTFDELFEKTRAVDWTKILPRDARITVDARSVKSALFGVSAVQSITKKAIAVSLCGGNKNAVLPETGAEYRILASIYADTCLLLIDTTGTALHKRGWRSLVGAAPLKETLAAAMVLLSVWRSDRAFCDMFCGSGTICIEAAAIGLSRAPGLLRDFAFSSFPNADGAAALERAKEEARQKEKRDLKLRICGFDISPDAVSLARFHLKAAGLEGAVHFQVGDMRNFSSRFAHGVAVTNPPYGERLCDRKELKKLYRDFGNMFGRLDEWSLFVLTACDRFEEWLGRRADRVRKLYNSELECGFYSFLGKPPRTKNGLRLNGEAYAQNKK